MPQVRRRVLLCMPGVLEVPEVMCRVLLYMLEAVESSGGSEKLCR